MVKNVYTYYDVLSTKKGNPKVARYLKILKNSTLFFYGHFLNYSLTIKCHRVEIDAGSQTCRIEFNTIVSAAAW